jgi:hypothetical protein
MSKRKRSARLSPALHEIDFVARQVECLNAKSGSAEENKHFERAKKAIALALDNTNEAESKQAWRVALRAASRLDINITEMTAEQLRCFCASEPPDPSESADMAKVEIISRKPNRRIPTVLVGLASIFIALFARQERPVKLWVTTSLKNNYTRCVYTYAGERKATQLCAFAFERAFNILMERARVIPVTAGKKSSFMHGFQVGLYSLKEPINENNSSSALVAYSKNYMEKVMTHFDLHSLTHVTKRKKRVSKPIKLNFKFNAEAHAAGVVEGRKFDTNGVATIA